MARGLADAPMAGCVHRQHLQRRDQQRRLARVVDERARQFDAGDFPVQSDEFDFIAFGRRLARQAAAQIVFHQLDIFRRNEIGQRLADGVRGAQRPTGPGNAYWRTGCACGEPAPRRAPTRPSAERAVRGPADARRALEIFQQCVDRDELNCAERARIALEPDAPRRARLARELQNLLGKFADGAFLAAFADEEHTAPTAKKAEVTNQKAIEDEIKPDLDADGSQDA